MAKKKKGRNLLILCLILAVLSAGYGGLRWYNTKQENAASDETAETENDAATLVNLEGEVASLSYTTGGTTLNFLHQDGVWVKEDEPEFPLKTAAVSVLATTLQNAEVYQSFEPADGDLAQYGLDEPQTTITMTDDTGASVKVLLGNSNTQAGGSYAMIEGSSQVILTEENLAEKYSSDCYSLAALPEGPSINDEDIDTVEVAYSDQEKYRLIHKAYGDDASDPTGACTLFFENEDGTCQAMDSEYETALIDAVTGFTYKSMVNYKPDEKDLESYGLKTPSAEITVNYTVEVEQEVESSETESDSAESASESSETEESEEPETITVQEPRTYVLTIGGYDENADAYYVMNAEDGYVYTMSSDTVSSLMDLDPAAMISLSPASIADDTVDSLDVTVDGTTTTYTIERTESTVADETDETDVADETATDEAATSDGEDSEAATAEEESDSEDSGEETTTTTTVYKKNGTEIEASVFSGMYDALTGLEGSRLLTDGEAVSGEPAITIIFHRNKETNPTVTLKLYAWNDNYYQMAVGDGDPVMTVDIGKVKSLLNSLSAE